MYPKLVEFGLINVYSYGLVLAAAILLSIKVATLRGRVRGINPTRVMDLSLFAIGGAFVGAKLLLLLVEGPHLLRDPWALMRSAGVFYGGFLVAVLVAVCYMRVHAMSIWTTCDVFAPAIAIGQCLGRLGCFFAGCCYGRPTDLPFGIVFTSTFAAANVGTPLHIRLHPTQLYESAAAFAIFCLLLLFERRGQSFAGQSFLTYLLAYSTARFIIEFYRGDPRGMVFGIAPTSQFISALLLLTSLVILIARATRASARPA